MVLTAKLCSYAIVVWAWSGVAEGSYDEFMSCGSGGGGGRDGFGRNFHYRPEVPCDLGRNGWCESAGNQYPWQSVRRFVYENQGLMKRMYGDQRHISVLRTELMDNMFEEMSAPNVYRYQPHPPEPPPLPSPRNSKKIKRNGRGGARLMEVTMEPEINKNIPNGKTAQKKTSSSSSKVSYSRVSITESRPDIHQKVHSRNRPPKAPPSQRRRIPVKAKLKPKTKVNSASTTTSSTKTSSTTDTTSTSTAPITHSTSPATKISTKDETTESTRTTKQMQDQLTTVSDTSITEPELETTIRDSEEKTNESSTTEEITTNVQDTIEPTTDNPPTTSVDETTVEIDGFTTVDEGTEMADLLQAEFRDGAGPELYDGAFEGNFEHFSLAEEQIGGPSRHRETLTTAPGNPQEAFSSYTSISSDTAPPSSLTANTPSLSEISTKKYESSTARSEFPLDFEDDFLSASHDDGDLETIIFEEDLDEVPEETIPLNLEERIAQDYKSSTEGSDLTTLTLAERIDQAVEVRITGSSYPKDEIDEAMEKTLAGDDALSGKLVGEEEDEETEGEDGVEEHVEKDSKIPPEPVLPKPLKGINACPVKEEVVAPYWANNTRGEVLALLNMYPFEQYVHWEKCTHENRQMYCRNGCRCEQQYRLHRLLAFDPSNECRGIFSDWFRFPSCCVCKCYNLHHNIFEGSSRRPRLQSTPEDEYFDEEEDYYYDEEEEEYDNNETDYVDDGRDYVIEDFNLEQFENQEPEEQTRRNQRSQTGSVQPSKITPQRAPRPYSRPKSHIAPPSPSLLPPSPNLLPPPTNNYIKSNGKYQDSTNRRISDKATPTVYHNSSWIRENGRALPLFRIPRNAPEYEENEQQEEE